MPSKDYFKDPSHLSENLSSLFDDLRIQREFSRDDLAAKKTKMLTNLKAHFNVLRMKIPKHLANVPIGTLFEKGILNDDAPEATYIECISAMDGANGLNALQSTIRECNYLKPTPKFDDISAISVGNKGDEKRKRLPVRSKLNLSTAIGSSPYKSLTKSRLIMGSKKRKVSILSPCKPTQVVSLIPNLDYCNYEKFLGQLTTNRNQSIQRITEQKEHYLEQIKKHFNEIRKKALSLEKEYTAYRDAGNLETFFTKQCKL